MRTDRTESLEKARAGQSIRLSSNALLNSIGSLAYYGAVAIVTPLAIRSLGEQTWGIWQFVGAVTAYALLCSTLSGKDLQDVHIVVAKPDFGSTASISGPSPASGREFRTGFL